MIDLEKIKKEKKIEELINFGIINIDKPNGPTSFSITDYIRKQLGLNKTSHMGTLDPGVSGVLPILLGRACRLSSCFMKKDKSYVGIMSLHKEIEEEKLKQKMKKFEGKIKQLPPVKSRVKREEREREVYKFELLEKEGREVLFLAEVEAGTYIRKLIHDLGLEIGGAHMSELRRIKAGIFDENDKNFVNLYNFDKAIEEWKNGRENKLREIVIPAEIVSRVLPVIEVKKESLKRLYTGSPVFKSFLKGKKLILEGAEKIAVFSGDKFIEVAKIVNEPDIIAKPEFVLN